MAGHFKQTSGRLEQAHCKRNSAHHLLLHSACDCKTILKRVRFPSLLQWATGRWQSSLCPFLKGACHLDRVLWSVAQAATVRHWGKVGRQAVGSDGPTSRVNSGSEFRAIIAGCVFKLPNLIPSIFKTQTLMGVKGEKEKSRKLCPEAELRELWVPGHSD